LAAATSAFAEFIRQLAIFKRVTIGDGSLLAFLQGYDMLLGIGPQSM
jgi:hypothetical protein